MGPESNRVYDELMGWDKNWRCDRKEDRRWSPENMDSSDDLEEFWRVVIWNLELVEFPPLERERELRTELVFIDGNIWPRSNLDMYGSRKDECFLESFFVE